ncbi:hypothetical protein BSLG_005964 [Batrachochytrium salamandrivorans]|nr:hypothetical protein BSLG_005964 [Batrachochytrium salamandrivorans]
MSDTTDVMDAMHSQAVCSPFQDLCMSDTSTEATSPQSATTLQEVGSDSSSVHSIETPLQINFHQEQNPDDVGNVGLKTAASTPNLCLSSPWQSQLKRRVPVGMLASELPISHSRPSQRYSVDTVNTRLHTNRKRFANQCVSDTSIRRSTGDLNLGVNSSNTGSHYTTSCKSGQMCYREMDEFVEWCEEMTGNMFNHYQLCREVSMPSYSSILQLAAIEESSESLSRSESLTRGSISTQNTSSISSEGGTSDEKRTVVIALLMIHIEHHRISIYLAAHPRLNTHLPSHSSEWHPKYLADIIQNKPKMSTSTVVKRLFSFKVIQIRATICFSAWVVFEFYIQIRICNSCYVRHLFGSRGIKA